MTFSNRDIEIIVQLSIAEASRNLGTLVKRVNSTARAIESAGARIARAMDFGMKHGVVDRGNKGFMNLMPKAQLDASVAGYAEAGRATEKLTKNIAHARERISQRAASIRRKNIKASTAKELKQIQGGEQTLNKLFGKQYLNPKTEAQFKSVKNVMSDLDKQTKKVSKGFNMAALGIMFFGMAIQRVFLGIFKSGSKAFQEIMHSVEGTTTGFDKLTDNMTYLKFVVGEALEPLAEALIPIIEWITSLAERFPGLTRVIVAMGIALGTIFFVGGTLWLGLGAIEGTLVSIGKLMIRVKNINWNKFMEALSSIKKTLIKIGDVLLESLIKNMKWISKNPIKSIGAAALVTGIILAVLWLMRLSEAMGGAGEFWKNFARGAMEFGAMFAASIQAGLDSAIVLAENAANKLINAVNNIKGVNISNIETGLNKDLSFSDRYSIALSENIDKLRKDLGDPEKGFIEGARTLQQIYDADLYPEISALDIGQGTNKEKMTQSIVLNNPVIVDRVITNDPDSLRAGDVIGMLDAIHTESGTTGNIGWEE